MGIKGQTALKIVLALSVLGALSCKTPNPKNDEVIFINPVGTSPGEDPVTGASSAPPGEAAILTEAVRPVRGGEKVLPAYHGAEPCRMALVGESPVAKSCSEGGIRKAVEMMQKFVKRARAEGIVYACIDCHPDEDDYSKLAPGVDIEFRKLLFLARPD